MDDRQFQGLSLLNPLYYVIAATTTGTLIAAPASTKKIRVMSYTAVADASVNWQFKSSGGTAISGMKYAVANWGICSNWNPSGWFETAAGEGLNISMSTTANIGGELTYFLITT